MNAGYSPSRIERQIRARTLERVHATAYIDLTVERSFIEHWLAVLDGLVAGARCPLLVSHRSAAVLHHLDGFNQLDGFDLANRRYESRPSDVGGFPVDVTVHYWSVVASKAAIRSRTFDLNDSVTMHGLPVTSLARTILDLSEFASPDLVEVALESALRPGEGSRPDEWNSVLFEQIGALSSVMDRKKGTAIVRRLVAARGSIRPTGSLPETLVVQALRQRSLVLARQVTIRIFSRRGKLLATFYPDLADLFLGVLIEIDGLVAHGSAKQQQYDLERQNVLANFFTVRRYSAADVLKNRAEVARSIVRIIDAASTRSSVFTNVFGRVTLTPDGADVVLR